MDTNGTTVQENRTMDAIQEMAKSMEKVADGITVLANKASEKRSEKLFKLEEDMRNYAKDIEVNNTPLVCISHSLGEFAERLHNILEE